MLLDPNYYLDATTFEEFSNKIKSYYALPREERDNESYGDAWVEKVPEAKKYDPYFKYVTNSNGFRDSKINFNVDICYYGCSITYGMGVPVTTRYTNIIDKSLKYKSNNFGISGISTEEILKIFIMTSKFIKMKKAFFLLPDIHRYTIPIPSDNGTQYLNMHPNYKDLYTEKEFLTVSKHFFSLPESYFVDKFRTTVHTIIELGQSKGIELYFSGWSPDYNLLRDMLQNQNVKVLDRMITDNNGRDMIVRGFGHPGIEAHQLFAKNCISEIKNG